MRNHALRSLSVCLVTISCSLSSCIVQSWRGLPPPHEVSLPDPRTQTDSSIYFYIPQYLTEGLSYSSQPFAPPPQFAYKFFKQRLATSTEFKRAKLTLVPPEKGVFCSIRISEESDHPISRWSGIFMVLTPLTLWLIPSYDHNLGYHVSYEVYIDAKMQQRYMYDVHGKTLQWAFAVFALPFLSGAWDMPLDPYHQGGGTWNDPLADALWSTMRQFWVDAQRDGFL